MLTMSLGRRVTSKTNSSQPKPLKNDGTGRGFFPFERVPF